MFTTRKMSLVALSVVISLVLALFSCSVTYYYFAGLFIFFINKPVGIYLDSLLTHWNNYFTFTSQRWHCDSGSSATQITPWDVLHRDGKAMRLHLQYGWFWLVFFNLLCKDCIAVFALHRNWVGIPKKILSGQGTTFRLIADFCQLPAASTPHRTLLMVLKGPGMSPLTTYHWLLTLHEGPGGYIRAAPWIERSVMLSCMWLKGLFLSLLS